MRAQLPSCGNFGRHSMIGLAMTSAWHLIKATIEKRIAHKDVPAKVGIQTKIISSRWVSACAGTSGCDRFTQSN